MLHQLPSELLQAICDILDDSGLCAMASLCHSLHVPALVELFTRHDTFTPLPPRIPSRVLSPGKTLVSIQPLSGVCLSLSAPDKLQILLGLRIALPHLFNEHPVTAIICSFTHKRKSTLVEGELKSLKRFLVESSGAANVEAVVLDLEGYLVPRYQEPSGLPVLDLLLLFSDAARKLPRCKSLTIANGQVCSSLYGTLDEPSWLRSGHMGSNMIQAVKAMTSRALRQFPASQSSTSNSLADSTSFGLHTLNIHSNIIFHRMLTQWSLDLFGHRLTSLRTLSISMECSMWNTFLSNMNLPRLEELYLNNCGRLEVLSNFLVRHPTIKVLDPGPANNPMGAWSPPPLFLPNLTVFITSGHLLIHILKSTFGPRPLPSLKSLALTVTIHTIEPFIYHLWYSGVKLNDYATRRLNDLELGLMIYMRTFHTGWMNNIEASRDPNFGAQIAVCNKVTFIQIHIECHGGFLENQEIRCHLPKWLQLFPALESLEIWRRRLMNTNNSLERQKLAYRCKELNPSLRVFCVDDVHLI